MSAGTETAPRAARHPLRGNRDFRHLWIAQATSEFGSSVSWVAMPLLMLATTGSAAITGLAGTAGFATSWLLQLPSGYIADHWNRRRVMLVCEAVRAASQLALIALILLGRVQAWLVLGLFVATSAAWTVFGSAQQRTMRALIRAEQIPEAVAANQARGYAADLAGPLLGGVLFGLARVVPFLVDTASYAISATAIAAVAPRDQVRARSPQGLGHALRQIRGGLRYVWEHRLLRSATLYSALSNFTATGLLYVVIINAGQQRGGAAAVGVSLSVAAGGGILGAALAPRVQRRLSVRTILLATGVVRVLLLMAFALTTEPVLMGALLAGYVLVSPVASTALATARTLAVPQEILGRAGSSGSFVATALQPFAPLAFGLLLTHLHERTMYVIAALTVLITLYVWRTAGFAHRAAGRLPGLADDNDQD
jgi:Transmembrane secretion effector